jgi:hypothetical protein
MNKNTIIAAVAMIVALPFIYLVLDSLKGDPLPRFRGREVVTIDSVNGTTVVPTAENAKKGEPLKATFTTAFVEQITTKKMTNTRGLELTIHTVTDKFQDCEADSAIPARAEFKVAQMCAPAAFEKTKDPKKTIFFMVPEEQFIVFGKSGENHTKVYHNGMVATYDSADMTQSDRKYEACLVRIMMDFIIGLPLDDTKTCAVKP